MSLIADNWQYITAVIGATFALGSFIFTRRAELSWKRTEFLFEQAKYIETDADISNVIAILTNREPRCTLNDVLDEKSELSDNEKARLAHALDKLLNVFDRIYYAVEHTKTLNIKEICIFGWYLDAITEHNLLRDYCKNNGFADVLHLAERLNQSNK